MTMPAQKRGRSKQDHETPDDFIRACVMRFGQFSWDLAANEKNAKAPRWLGPGSRDCVDALSLSKWTWDGTLWLNPEFADIDPWAGKAALSGEMGARILLLTPLSGGANWWRKHIHNRAHVFMLQPRLTFVGSSDPYPKDLALSVWNGPNEGRVQPSYQVWNWKTGETW